MKKLIYNFFITCIVILAGTELAYSAYLRDVKVEVTQPNGEVIECYASGDEFYNWLHDENGYTIIQNQTDGYYYYAVLQSGNIVASSYKIGTIDPRSTNLVPNVKISAEELKILHNKSVLKNIPAKPKLREASKSAVEKTTQTLNNLVVYIRFADQTEFPANQATYTSMFNNTTSGSSSMRNYFSEVSYNQLTIPSHFYPSNNGTTIVSYQDSQNRGYYMPYSTTNTIGYSTDAERTTREHTLLQNAIINVRSQIPTTLDLDYDNDGYVDNVCFIVRGGTTAWSTLLWPHRWALYSYDVRINGDRVYDFNFQLETHLASSGVGVLCHEMYHTLGSPDLYHYTDNFTPVGGWDVMEWNANPPQHMGTYMKFTYGNWITSIPEITTSGTYTLNPITSSTNNCYKISIPNSNEYFVLEYRRKTGTFENQIPNSGLIIYRINDTHTGNASATGAGGANDEVYAYRPNGTLSADGSVSLANFSSESGRVAFNSTTNPNTFTSSGSIVDIAISNVTSAGSTISFTVDFNCQANLTVTENISGGTHEYQASSTVNMTSTISNNANVHVGANNTSTLNPGFSIQLGSQITVDANGCN